MRRLTWPEMLDYWQAHARRFSDLDYVRDPDGLENVCGPGQPLWLSEYLARSQRRVFDQLLATLGRPAPGSTALDIGTGAGRWAKRLADVGFRTTGIDLQRKLIEDNRRRFPDIEFHDVSVQEYEPESPFDLVSSVTVLQHVPFDEQHVVLRRLREMTKAGGHAVVLEHVLDQSPHVFSRSADGGWQGVFRDAGFECLVARRYQFSPALRVYSSVRRRIKQPSWTARDAELRPEDLVAAPVRRARTGLHRGLRAGDRALLRTAVALDHVVEPLLIARQVGHPRAADCGFLFRAA